jgi:hypothetical protein
MDDFGSLIYVAFIAVSIIAGYFNNQKKKRAAQEAKDSVGQEAPSAGPSREEIERMIDLERIAQKEASAKLEELRVSKTNTKNIRPETIRSRAKRKREVDDVEENSEHALFDVTEEFDARKAVIYSEILNPPYL